MYIGFVNHGFEIIWCEYLWVATSRCGGFGVLRQENLETCSALGAILGLLDPYFNPFLGLIWDHILFLKNNNLLSIYSGYQTQNMQKYVIKQIFSGLVQGGFEGVMAFSPYIKSYGGGGGGLVVK